MSSTETLKTTLLGPEFEPYKEQIMRKLLGIQMLASVQENLCRDIEGILSAHGKYRYSMKMNMKQLHRDVAMNIHNDSFFGRMSQEQIDNHITSYEKLEKLIYDFIEGDADSEVQSQQESVQESADVAGAQQGPGMDAAVRAGEHEGTPGRLQEND